MPTNSGWASALMDLTVCYYLDSRYQSYAVRKYFACINNHSICL